MGLLGRRNREDEMIEGEPSMLGRARQGENGHADGTQDPAGPAPADEVREPDDVPAPEPALPMTDPPMTDPPEGVKDQLERLAGQIRGLEHQVEEFVARRTDAVADQASQRVAAIVQAAEESAAEISAEAHKEGAELRERLRSEAQAEADRIRIEAQAEASKIRTEAHAAAARLREETLAEVRSQVERITERLADELRTSARTAIDAIAGSPGSVAVPEAAPEPEVPAMPAEEPSSPEVDEAGSTEVEEAVDELQSAAAVLEESLRHLQQIGQGFPEGP
jgi:F0F1-type ATP synthase membrane subunit b/b'